MSGSNSLEIDLTGWNVFAVGTIPIGKKFELFGKGGVLLWDADFSGTVFTTRESGTDLAFGIGGSYQVGNSVRIRGEYEIYEIDNVSDVTMISGGVEIRF